MDHEKQRLLDDLFLFGVESLDLTESQHADAVRKYSAVGQWLDAPDSALQVYSPTIFPQGSIAIGTACKPVGRDEMDIDLVCEMILPPEINQSQAKQLVGARLKENATYAEMVNEKNRCWRLIYAGQFYMDILPAKPDGRLPTETALAVPDKKLHHWKETDPKGYAAWFSVKTAQSRIKESITIQAGVEPVPEYVAVGDKSPLQIAVQLSKRHRDVSLYGDGDAPISIILTTLAARAYQGQRSIYATLAKLLERMPTVIEYDTDGRPYVSNPVNTLENFADKWHHEPRKKQVFEDWIAQAQEDLRLLASATLSQANEPLAKFLGERSANQALKKYGERMHSQRKTGLDVVTASGLLGKHEAGATPIRTNTFFGSTTRRQGLG